jgi:dTDP-4-dehydrorhamnose reductase
MNPRVLIVGGSGMLGHKLVQVLGADPALEVHATVRRPPPEPFRALAANYHDGVELGPRSDRLQQVLREVRPGVVINAVGAIKQKDLYENVDETFYLNGTLPHLLALFAQDDGARIVHFSTDCVFVGDRGGYGDADTPDALDLYGRSKACGEVDYSTHLTVRTSIIGFEIAGHLGLLSWFLRQPRGSTLSGYTRAIYSGLPTATLARTVRALLDRPEIRGLYTVASEPIAKYDLLQRVNAAFDLGHTLAPNGDFVMDRSLDDTRFRRATGTRRPGWDELVDDLVADFASAPYAQVYNLHPIGLS